MLGEEATEEVYEPVEVYGFGEVGVAAGGEGLGAIFGFVMGGEGDDQHVAHGVISPNAARGFDAVHEGEADVHDDDAVSYTHLTLPTTPYV